MAIEKTSSADAKVTHTTTAICLNYGKDGHVPKKCFNRVENEGVYTGGCCKETQGQYYGTTRRRFKRGSHYYHA
eukprot:9477811-Pyramimonas_sp.AAC.1